MASDFYWGASPGVMRLYRFSVPKEVGRVFRQGGSYICQHGSEIVAVRPDCASGRKALMDYVIAVTRAPLPLGPHVEISGPLRDLGIDWRAGVASLNHSDRISIREVRFL